MSGAGPSAGEPDGRVAVIGLACRFPGASDPERFWTNLCAGVEPLSWTTAEEMRSQGVPEDVILNPSRVPGRFVLRDVDRFDADFFRLTPREAELMDPQQRLFLECCWEALESAGVDPSTSRAVIGLFAGSRVSTYALALRADPWPSISQTEFAQLAMANDRDYLTTRVSYRLNLTGPSVVVLTACSTSLVAVHMACQSLLAGECDLALAGGVSIDATPNVGYRYQEGSVLSPDGHCRPFAADAAGTVPGDGVGVVVLRRLTEAMAGDDPIRAVILGTAVNNDGADKAGYTAPSVTGQARAIAEALEVAGVSPDTVTYVEAHGTGTAIGDPIEVQALTEVFRAATERTGFCALGSVKSNVGHLDAAAGVAGLIKAVLAVERGQIPPSLHLSEPSGEIPWESTAFFPAAELTGWNSPGPRRAGVSSFGIGGTNAHVVVEEPPPVSTTKGRGWQLLPLSARSPRALAEAEARLEAHLAARPATHPAAPPAAAPEEVLARVGHTLRTGRQAFEYRFAMVASDRTDAAQALRAGGPDGFAVRPSADPGEVVFLFPGQGAQHVGMGKEVLEAEPAFAEPFEGCATVVRERLGVDLRRVLFPEPEGAEEAGSLLDRTLLAQPAIFSVSLALAELWRWWGVRPAAMIGHSLGEYVAACVSGVLSPRDAATVVCERAVAMMAAEPGAMTSVRLPEAQVRALLLPGVSVSAVNGPAATVAAGHVPDVERFEEALRRRGVPFMRLRTSHAFHTEMMRPAANALARLLRTIPLRPPSVPFVSNLTGTWITAGQATDPAYWQEQMVRPVRFSQGVSTLLDGPDRIFVEMGPGRALGGFVRRGRSEPVLAVPALAARAGEDAEAATLRALGAAWAAGATVDWAAFDADEDLRKVPIPTYPFERRSYWLHVDGLRPRRIEDDRAGAVASVGDRAVPVAPTPTGLAWSEVRAACAATLGVPDVAMSESFFDLGGDSLSASSLIEELRRRLGVEVPLQSVFDRPTLRDLAEEVESALARAGDGMDHRVPVPGGSE